MKSHSMVPASARRFGEVLTLVDQDGVHEPAVHIALRLVTDIAVLNAGDLRMAASKEAQAYRDEDVFYIEWPRGSGFLDRRVLSPRLANAVAAHGGLALRQAEWAAAIKQLRSVYGAVDGHMIWRQFLADACCWWSDHLPPVLMVHVTKSAPFQPLDRRALARRAKLRGRQ